MLNWKEKNDQWFCYKDGQKLISKWVQDDKGKFYYLEKDGHLVTGWFQTATDNDLWFYSYSEKTEKDGNIHYTGEMATGWIEIDSKWYYLLPQKTEFNGDTHYKGEMVCNTTLTIDGKLYNFNENGVWKQNINILSDKGADFIGSWEGFWAKADYDPCYPRVEKYITIGYGTTYEAIPSAFSNGIDSTCTIEQAREWLEEEAQNCAKTIKSDLDSRDVSLSQNELDALISFAYNCGAGALLGSTLYKNVIAGVKDIDTITSNFQAWSNANGKRETGLYKRRTSEAALFLNADYTGNV